MSQFCLNIYSFFSCGKIDPLTWQLDCVNGNCENCHEVKMMIDTNILKESHIFTMGTKKVIKGSQSREYKKKKYAFPLGTETTTMEDAIECLKKILKKLALHIFTAAKQ